MADDVDLDRRRFLGKAAMTIAAAHLGMFRTTDASGREPRELAALSRATEWLNSPPLSAASLAGKVVLVDFWTYTCINWLRTLPYIRAWTQKYRQGLVVVGVHTPEFEVERNVDNVRRAVRQMGIDLSGRHRQRLFNLACVQQPVLACPVLGRCTGSRAPALLWRR